MEKEKNEITECLVLEPRMLSGQRAGQIIKLWSVENEPDEFYLFGGKYKKIKNV